MSTTFRPQGFVHVAGHPGPCPVEHDLYLPAAQVVRLRVLHDGSDNCPWQVDGVDDLYHYTEAVWNFESFAEAIGALPEVAAELGLSR